MLLGFRLLRKLVTYLVLAIVLVVAATAGQVWWVARQDDTRHSDAIVVLGASQYDGKPTTVFRARLLHAKVLFDQGVAPRVITLGGKAEGDRFTEAQAGADFLKERGVKAIAVGEGRNTLESMQALSRELGQQHWRSVVIVTDPWHSLRSRRMARDLGIQAVTSPTRSGPAVRTRAVQARYIARETAAYLYYRIFHRSSEAGPRAI